MLKSYVVCYITTLFMSDVVLIKSHSLFSSEWKGWFKLHEIPATWYDASLVSHNEDAVLASPLDFSISIILRSLMTASSVARIHLGANTLRSENNIFSLQETPLGNMYTMEWATHDEDEETGDCLSFSSDLKVYTSSCEQLIPFICYIKERESLNTTTKIYVTDMSAEMQLDAVNDGTLASTKFNSNVVIADYVKKEFKRKYNGTWQCIVYVGNKLGLSYTYQIGYYIRFSVGDKRIILFKCP